MENKKEHRTWSTTCQQPRVEWFGSKDLPYWITWQARYQNRQCRNKWIINKPVKCVGLKSKIWLWRMFWSYKAEYVQWNKVSVWVKIIPLKAFTSMKRLLLLNKYLLKQKSPTFINTSNCGSKWSFLVPDSNNGNISLN